MGYFGSKATSGLCQPLIAMIPPHDTYIETHLGGGAIMKRKPAALRNIGIDRDARALDAFECDYPVELVHGCAHRYLAEFEFQGSELVYSDPPYLKRTRTSRRRYVAQLHRSLAEWERHAIERLLASPAMHVDETSLRVDRKNHWIHVYSAGTLTVKRLHPKRGCEAHRGHRHHPALRRRRGARLLGLLLELHALRARIMRCALAARADLHRRCP